MIVRLGRHDLHWLFAREAGTIEAWNGAHQRIFMAQCRNRTTADGQFGHDGNLPYGEYVFGVPSLRRTPPFGPWFVPITDAPGHDELASRGRSGLGLHGGGSGLPRPLAEYQSPPWVVTHGCLRMVNHDLKTAVAIIQEAHRAGGTCYLTNVEPVPGASLADGSDYLDVDEKDLAPDE